jgi:hypothetical protein
MKRATVTFPEDLQEALERYLNDQAAPPALTSVVQAAVREYLADRGYLAGRSRVLHITPAERGSGFQDVSSNHDRYIAER